MSPYSTIAVTYAAHAHVAVRRPMIRFVMFCAQRGKNQGNFHFNPHAACVSHVYPRISGGRCCFWNGGDRQRGQ